MKYNIRNRKKSVVIIATANPITKFDVIVCVYVCISTLFFHGKLFDLAANILMLSSKLTQVVSSHFPLLNCAIRDFIKLQKYINERIQDEQMNE